MTLAGVAWTAEREIGCHWLGQGTHLCNAHVDDARDLAEGQIERL